MYSQLFKMHNLTIQEFKREYPHDIPPTPPRVKDLLNLPPVNKNIQKAHSWNPNDKSPFMSIKKNDFNTVYRQPITSSTDCIRTKQGYTNGIHAWEFKWDTQKRGTHAIVGVAEINARIRSYGYASVVGSSEDSWGWDISKNKLYHSHLINNSAESYPIKNENRFKHITIPETFKMILDMNLGTLAFIVDNEYLGVAFKNIHGKRLFPIVNVVFGRAEVTCQYLGGIPPSLLFSCRKIIRNQIEVQEPYNSFTVGEKHPFKSLPFILTLYVCSPTIGVST